MIFLCHLCIAPIPCTMYDTAQGSDATCRGHERDVWATPTRPESRACQTAHHHTKQMMGITNRYSRRVFADRGDANVFRHPLSHAVVQPSPGFPPVPTCGPGAPVSRDSGRAILPHGAQNSAGSEYITHSTSMSRAVKNVFPLSPSAPRSVTAARSASRSAPDEHPVPSQAASTQYQYRTGSPGGPR